MTIGICKLYFIFLLFSFSFSFYQYFFSKKKKNSPSRYYEITETLVTGEIAQFIYIDTSILVCQSEIPPQSPDLKGGDCLDSGSKEIYQEQLSWLKKQLAKNSRWKIVIGHFPIFSAGNHGDSVELINDILPLFHEFKVDLYFCGHDHTLQHLRQKVKLISFRKKKTQSIKKLTFK